MNITIAGSMGDVSPIAWNGLLSQQDHPGPVLSHEFLWGLESTGCTTAQTGWQPIPMVVKRKDGELHAACPLYLKSHSYGEYVFDWAWAEAYGRAGLSYFPKLLVASPFSPIPGTRLFVCRENQKAAIAAKRELLAAIQSQAISAEFSSAHVLFADPADVSALREEGWLIRESVQFHWHNRGYGSFEDYLGALTQPKRKKIRAERRKVRDAGVSTELFEGAEVSREQILFFYQCYERTYREHQSTPYMSLGFFEYLFSKRPQDVVLCLAKRNGAPIAASLLLCADGVLYGRYWGAIERVDCLHFELAYYAPIEWAIQKGAIRFEGGAQGEHKLSRGFEPMKTYSGHWLREPAFYDAVARYLERESKGIEAYVNELEARNPVRG